MRMDYEKTKTAIGDLWHVVTLILLVALVLGIITWMGLIRCNQLPGWCQVYDPLYLSLTGKKEVLIVYGDDGLGNPDLLFAKLRDPKLVGVIPYKTHISRIGQGNLQNYDLVIVEKARTMSTLKLQQFMDYVDAGGKLIWTGDAGTKLAAGDSLLYEDDLDENAAHNAFSPWARRDGKNAVRFDSVISVSYLGNYCEVRDCGKNSPVGRLLPEATGEHQLIYGMAENQQLYVNSDPLDLRDFALVQEPESIGSKRILTLDYGSVLKGKEEQEFGRYFPVIVTSGVGEKIAYYAQPPEQFIGTYWNYETGKNETGPMSLLIANLYKFYRK
jgi:hypothetical protein